MLNISRTPLREALKVLAAEGLVELLPNRGARVRPLSEQDLGELFDVMGGLEGLAGRLACEHITDAEIAEIERLHYEMYGFYLHRDMHGYFHVNQLIHQKIVEASRNATLKSDLRELRRADSPGALLRQFCPQARALGRSDARTRDHPGRACAAAPAANSATSCSSICATSGPPRSSICKTGDVAASEPA